MKGHEYGALAWAVGDGSGARNHAEPQGETPGRTNPDRLAL